MANQYLYGTYGEMGQTVAQNASQSGTVLVYFGTAAINLLRGYADLDIVNKPVKLYNIADAQQKVGYSKDWANFTLCEAITGHFDNLLGNIGPIIVVNVLDPDVHRKDTETTKNLTFSNGRAEFVSDKIILDTFAMEDKVEGVDYALDYNYTKGSVIVTSLKPESPITGSVTASYYEIDGAMVEPEDIIGGVTANGEYTGLGVLQLVYTTIFEVPNLIAAPGWSHSPAVYNAMVAASQKINGRWYAFVVADMPIADTTGAIDTIIKAKTWKTEHGYNSEHSKVCWPQGKDNLGRVFHLSTLVSWEMLLVDFSHDSIPFETPANKAVPIVKQYFGAASTNKGYDQETANQLTSAGITTVVAGDGNWVIWGDHTAAYTYGATSDARVIFDTSIRMMGYILNSFIREWRPSIDKPMDLKMIERIQNREQEKLDALVGIGALIGSPSFEFLQSQNPPGDLMNGNFKWNTLITPTPPFKSGTDVVSFTDAGFSVYYEGGAA